MTSALAPAPQPARQPAEEVQRKARGLGSRRGNVIAGIAAWAIGILFVFPVFYMVLTSLHSETQRINQPAQLLRPAHPGRATRSSSVHPREPARGRR